MKTNKIKIELTFDEIQTVANTLFEFVEDNKQEITREEELKKIRSLYKKLYNTLNLNQKNNKKSQYKKSSTLFI